MKRLRLWLTLIVIWYFLLYNIERLSEPINIASFVYVYILVISVLMLILPPIYSLPLYGPFLAALIPFFILKNQLGYKIGGSHLPITITEVLAIGLTIYLIGQFLRELKELKEAVNNLTISQLDRGSYPFETGQGQIYREVRRARLNQRPAALLAITVKIDEMYKYSINRFIQEAQRDIINKYISARLAHLLLEELRDFDVITQRNNHFVALLPETSREEGLNIANRLTKVAHEKLGLDLHFGLSAFPDEAVTFERLLECAESEMKSSSPRGEEPVSTAQEIAQAGS